MLVNTPVFGIRTVYRHENRIDTRVDPSIPDPHRPKAPTLGEICGKCGGAVKVAALAHSCLECGGLDCPGSIMPID